MPPLDKAQKRFIDKRVDRTKPNDPALFIEAVSPGKIRIHSRHIRYGDDDGVQQPIVLDLQRDGADLVEIRNTIRFRSNDSGRVSYQVGAHSLQMRLVDRTLQHLLNVGVETLTAIPEVTKVNSRCVRWVGMLGDEFEIGYEVLAGSVKETITLPAMPDLGSAEAYEIGWQWQSNTLTPELVDGAVHWKDADGNVPLRFPAPKAWDVAGPTRGSIPTQFVLKGNRLGVRLPADKLKTAMYPVVIDPTATTGASDVTDSVGIYEDIEFDYFYQASFIKFENLPDLTGYNIDAASLFLYAESNSSGEAYDFYCDVTGAWTSASSVSTLVALSFNGVVDAASGPVSTSTWYEFDILGDSGKGIKKIYDDASGDPSAVVATVKMNWTSETMAPGDKNAHIIGIGYDPSVQFADDNDATYYPYIEIDYSAPTTTVTGSVDLGGITVAGTVVDTMTCVGDVEFGSFEVAGTVVRSTEIIGDVALGAVISAGSVFVPNKEVIGDVTLGVQTVAGVVPNPKEAAGTVELGGVVPAGLVIRIFSGTGGVTLGVQTVAGEVTRTVTASGGVTLGAIAPAGSVIRVFGTVGFITLGTLALTGNVISALGETSAALVLGSLEVAGTVVRSTEITGDVTLPAGIVVAGAMVFTTTVTGTGGVTLGTLQAAAEVSKTGTRQSVGDVTLGSIEAEAAVSKTSTAQSAGGVTLGGLGVTSEAIVLTVHQVSGDIILTATAVSAAAMRSTEVTGSANLAAIAVAGMVLRSIDTSGVIELGGIEVAAIAAPGRTIEGSVTLGSLIPAGLVRSTWPIIGDVELGAVIPAGTGVRTITIIGGVDLSAVEAVGSAVYTRKSTGAIVIGAILVHAKVNNEDGIDYQWYRVTEITKGPGTGTRKAVLEAVRRPVARV